MLNYIIEKSGFQPFKIEIYVTKLEELKELKKCLGAGQNSIMQNLYYALDKRINEIEGKKPECATKGSIALG